MFVQLAALVPLKGVIVMTLSRGATEGNLRLTLHPRIPEADVEDEPGISRLKPIVFDDVKPSDLDDPTISFEPMVEAKLSIQETIKAAAEASKKATVEETAAGVKKTTTSGRKTTVKYEAKHEAAAAAAAPPAQPELGVANPAPAPDVKPDTDAAEKANAEAQAKVEAAKAEVIAKANAEAKAKMEAEKKAKADDAKAKQAELASKIQKAEELGFKW